MTQQEAAQAIDTLTRLLIVLKYEVLDENIRKQTLETIGKLLGTISQ